MVECSCERLEMVRASDWWELVGQAIVHRWAGGVGQSDWWKQAGANDWWKHAGASDGGRKGLAGQSDGQSKDGCGQAMVGEMGWLGLACVGLVGLSERGSSNGCGKAMVGERGWLGKAMVVVRAAADKRWRQTNVCECLQLDAPNKQRSVIQ